MWVNELIGIGRNAWKYLYKFLFCDIAILYIKKLETCDGSDIEIQPPNFNGPDFVRGRSYVEVVWCVEVVGDASCPYN